jgi:C-terminal processing protease CtpA/Prc
MMRLALLAFCALMLVSPDTARGQQPPAPPAPPASAAPPAPMTPEAFTTFQLFGGGNFLGVSTEEITRANMASYGLSGEPRGVGVREVVKGSPAERAGLRAKDVIVRFDGEAVTSVRKLTRLIDESAPEHAARITVLRGGSQQEVSATLGRERDFTPAFEARSFGFDPGMTERWAERWRHHGEEWQRRGEEMRKRLEEVQRNNPEGFSFFVGGGRTIGVTTSPLGKQLADYFGVQHGVLVNSVVAGSPADKAGLKAGDVITEAEGEKVDDGGDLSRLINRREEGEVTLTVTRERARRTVRLTPEKRREGSFNILPGGAFVAPPAPMVAPQMIAPRVLVPPRAPRAPRPAIAPRVRVIRGGNVI